MEAKKDIPAFDLVDDDSALDILAEHQPDITDQVSHLRWAIARLKPIEQEIILLMIDEDSSLAQIAVILNMPVGTVKSHVHRAKENLRQIMEVKNEP